MTFGKTIAHAHCPECDYEGPLDHWDTKREEGFFNSDGYWYCPNCSLCIDKDLIAFDEVECGD